MTWSSAQLNDCLGLVDQLFVQKDAVGVIDARLITFSKGLGRIRSVLEKAKTSNEKFANEDLLLLQARLYEFVPILRHLAFSKDAEGVEKLQQIAATRDIVQTYDAAFGRLRRDIQFLNRPDAKGKKPFTVIFGEKNRKKDIIKDTKKFSEILRSMFATSTTHTTMSDEMQDVADKLTKAIKDSESQIADRAKYFARLDPMIQQLAKMSADEFDDAVFLDTIDQKEAAVSPDQRRALKPVQHRKSTSDNLIFFSDVLGHSNFGPVIKGEYKNFDVALKPIPRPQDLSVHGRAALRTETGFWKSLRHENVCHLHGILFQDLKRYLAMDLCETTLFDLMHPRYSSDVIKDDTESATKKIDAALPGRKRNQILLNIANGLAYLHSKNVLHKNLKPDNILIINRKPYVKLTSFGFVLLRDESDSEFSNANAEATDLRRRYAPYKAPEIQLDESAWTPVADVYSLGIIAWEMTQPNKFPFKEYSNIREAVAIREKRPDWGDNDIPEWLQSCAESCWDPKPEKRPRTAECVGILKTGARYETEFQRMSTARRATNNIREPKKKGILGRTLGRTFGRKKGGRNKSTGRLSRIVGRGSKKRDIDEISKISSVSDKNDNETGPMIANMELIEEEKKRPPEIMASEIMEYIDDEIRVSSRLEDLSALARNKVTVPFRIIETLTTIMEKYPSNGFIQANCLTVLRSATRTSRGKDLAIKSGVIELILFAMHEHSDESLVYLYGCLVLGGLAFGKAKIRAKLSELKVHIVLLKTMDDALQIRFSSWAISNFIRAAKAQNESLDDYVNELYENKAIEILNKAIGNKEVEIVINALNFLYNLLSYALPSESLLITLQKLVICLDHFRGNAQVQEYGCFLLAIIARTDEYKHELKKLGVIESVLETMTAHSQNKTIQNSTWRCLYVLIRDGSSVPAILSNMEKDARKAPKQVFGCMILRHIAHMIPKVTSYRDVDEKEEDNVFVKHNVLEFLLRTVIKNESSKQVLLELLRTVAEILRSQPVIRLDRDLFVVDTSDSIVEELCLIEESKLHRQFVDLKGFDIVFQTMEDHKKSLTMIDACLSVLEVSVNVGKRNKMDMFKNLKLYNRNALDYIPRLASLVLVAANNFPQNPNIMQKTLTITRDLAKWEEIRDRKDVIAKILHSGRVTKQEREDFLNQNEKIRLDCLQYFKTGYVEPERHASDLIVAGTPVIIETAMKEYGSSPVVMHIALEILFHLSKDDWGRVQMSQRTVLDMLKSVLGAYMEHYPQVVIICCELFERNILCSNCRRVQDQLNNEEHNPSSPVAELRFVWESDLFIKGNYECNNLDKVRCYTFYQQEFIDLLFQTISIHSKKPKVIKSVASALKSIAALSEEAMFNIEETMKELEPIMDIKSMVPWMEETYPPEGCKKGRPPLAVWEQNGPRPADLYHIGEDGKVIVHHTDGDFRVDFDDWGFGDISSHKNQHLAEYFKEELEISARIEAQRKGEYMGEQLDLDGLEAVRRHAKMLNQLEQI